MDINQKVHELRNIQEEMLREEEGRKKKARLKER